MLNRNSIVKNNKIWDMILNVGIITAPMTSLRLGKVGIAEICIFIWSLRMIIKYKVIRLDIFTRGFIIFDILLLLGLINRHRQDMLSGYPWSEFITYIYFTIFVLSLSIYFSNIDKDVIIKHYKSIFITGFFIYFGLYLYSFLIKRDFLGYQLWYGSSRLSILSDNPHQFMFFVGPMVFVGIKILEIVKPEHKKYYFFMLIGYLIMAIETKSSTFQGTIILILLINLFRYNLEGSKRKKVIKLILRSTLIIIILLLFYEKIYKIILGFIESDVNGIGRIYLLLAGINISFKNPILGLGPGAHIYDTNTMLFMEAHNTYIDIFLRMGILGLVNYLLILFESIKTTYKDKRGVSIILFFIFYGLSGYSIRRITLWFLIMSITYFNDKEVKK